MWKLLCGGNKQHHKVIILKLKMKIKMLKVKKKDKKNEFIQNENVINLKHL